MKTTFSFSLIYQFFGFPTEKKSKSKSDVIWGTEIDNGIEVTRSTESSSRKRNKKSAASKQICPQKIGDERLLEQAKV